MWRCYRRCLQGGWTALHWASYNGNVALITYLLGLGALKDVNGPTEVRASGFFFSCQYIACIYLSFVGRLHPSSPRGMFWKR